MISEEMRGRVLRAFLIEKLSKRAIAKSLGVSRNVVRGIVEDGPHIERRYQRGVQAYPVLGPFRDRLDALLLENCGRRARDRLNRKQIHLRLKEDGFAGSYDTVRRYAREWTKMHGAAAKAYVPQGFELGDAYEFDWSTEEVIIGGVRFTVKVAHFVLRHSRFMFARAYWSESQEMLFDAHQRAFDQFGGIPRRGIYDNAKTIVDKPKRGSRVEFNKRFLQFMNHHLIERTACSRAAPWEKGIVERQVRKVRDDIFTGCPEFSSLEDLNRRLLEHCLAEARNKWHPEFQDKTVIEVFEYERAALRSSGRPFDGYRCEIRKVTKTCLVHFDDNRYSVDASAACGSVEVYAYVDRLVFKLDGKVVGEHKRCFGSKHTIFDPFHYLPVIIYKPGAVRDGAPFKRPWLPDHLYVARVRLAKTDEGCREFVKILSAALKFGLGVIDLACQEALLAPLERAEDVLKHVTGYVGPDPIDQVTARKSLKAEVPLDDVSTSVPQFPTVGAFGRTSGLVH